MPDMWKESYRLGIDRIDNWHVKLFCMTEKLIDAVEEKANGDHKKDCVETVAFLKKYVVEHFADEEDYQRSIGYAGCEEHKKIHQRFVETVLNYEKRMIASDYDYKVVRAFIGSLTAWLIYHIAEADLKFAGKSRIRDMKTLFSCLDNFSASVYDVLDTMMGLNQSDIKKSPMPDHNFEGDLSVALNLIGDVKGGVTFVYSMDFACALIKSMMSMEPDCLDEMVSSAMAELTNIVSGGATIRLMNAGKSCDITPPEVSLKPRKIWEREGFLLNTHQGRLQVLLSLD